MPDISPAFPTKKSSTAIWVLRLKLSWMFIHNSFQIAWKIFARNSVVARYFNLNMHSRGRTEEGNREVDMVISINYNKLSTPESKETFANHYYNTTLTWGVLLVAWTWRTNFVLWLWFVSCQLWRETEAEKIFEWTTFSQINENSFACVILQKRILNIHSQSSQILIKQIQVSFRIIFK